MTDGTVWRFSLVAFAVAVMTISVGTAAGLAVVPRVGSYVGMLLGGFLAGLAFERRPLLEAGFAAALASLGILAVGAGIGTGVVAAVSTFGSIAPTALLTSILLSFAVGAFGAHFGNDTRDGLTTPVETTPSGSTASGTTTHTAVEEESSVTEPSDRPAEPGAPGGHATDDAIDQSRVTDDDKVGHGTELGESDDVELERE